MIQFKNRIEAGRQLAAKMKQYASQKDTIVLGLPRGGVVVAHEVAQALHLPLDVIIVRKIGFPFRPERAIGAVAQNGVMVLDDQLMKELNISKKDLAPTIAQAEQEIQDRLNSYRAGRLALDLTKKTVILVDDGIATGFTIEAALRSAHSLGARRIVVATPVISHEVFEKLRTEVADVVYVLVPQNFAGISQFYDDFVQVTDQEVVQLLHEY